MRRLHTTTEHEAPHRVVIVGGAFEMAELADDPAERDAWLRFAVVGAGPTGIELSGQIAELANRTLRPDYRAIDTASATISLLEAGPDVLAAYPERLRRRAERDLGKLGVDVRTGVLATGVDAEGVEVTSGGGAGERVPARTVIWAAGVEASPLARSLAQAAGTPVDRTGRLPVQGRPDAGRAPRGVRDRRCGRCWRATAPSA